MTATGWKIVRSYVADLREWARNIATQYTVAVVILVIGALLVLVALGFGVAAVFDFIETRYGANMALASVGGSSTSSGVVIASSVAQYVTPFPSSRLSARYTLLLPRTFVAATFAPRCCKGSVLSRVRSYTTTS